jgi:sigma54-dependent transcription regulator
VRRVLVAWLGKTDLRAPSAGEQNVGPIAQALEARPFDEAFLLSDYDESSVTSYLDWIRARTETRVEIVHEHLSGPTQFGEIHEAAVRGVKHALGSRPRDVALAFHLSPGTPAMAAVWILLGKTRFPAELIESSKEHGVRTASVPFDISADFIPDLLREQDERLRQRSAAESPGSPEFADIVHRTCVMARLIQRARRVAARNVPVLIEGESGTGKEMFARAIHRAITRRNHPFVEHFMVPVQEIEEKGFDLSINRYKETKHEAIEYDPPKKIVAKLRALEVEIAKDLSELEGML